MRKCRESVSLHFLIFSPFPPHFLILSPFPRSLAARLQRFVQPCRHMMYKLSFPLSGLDFIILGAIALVRHGKQMNKVFTDLMILSHERPCIVFLPTTCTVSSLLIVVSLSRSVSCLVLSSQPSAFVLLAVRNPRRDPPPCYGQLPIRGGHNSR